MVSNVIYVVAFFLNSLLIRWADVTVSKIVLDKLFPGQLTAVFTRKETLNPKLNPGTVLTGIRIPGDNFVRQLVRSCSFPIALTSANKSGSRSTLEIEVK